MEICNDLAQERFYAREPIAKKEIADIHSLYFETALKELAEGAAAMPIDYINPQPAYVFRSLFSSMQALQSLGGCEASIQSVEDHMTTRPETTQPSVAELLKASPIDRETGLKDLQRMGDEGNPIALEVLRMYNQHLQQMDEYTSHLYEHPLIPAHAFQEASTTRHINHTYVMLDSTHQKQWIFKPAELNGLEMCIREHMASLVNKGHHTFPIPLTLLVSIGGYTGSLQMFVAGAKTLGDLELEKKQDRIVRLDLKKIAMFDILFANTDRHADNIIFLPKGQVYRAFSIDHDQCFLSFGGKELKMEFIEHSAFDQPFGTTMLQVVSQDAVKQYQSALKIYESPGLLSPQWISYAAYTLEESIHQGTAARQIIQDLIENWEKSEEPF